MRFELEGVHAAFFAVVFDDRRTRTGIFSVPVAETEHARTHADDGVALFFLFQESGESRAHGDFGALAHVRQQVLFDRQLGDLFVVQRLAGKAEHFHCSFGKGHSVISVVVVSVVPGLLVR